MTEEFNIQALEYLLEELDPAERAAFETRLAREPHARAALKACADGVARFACDHAPAEPLTATDQRRSLAAILHATGPWIAPAPARVFAPFRVLWPIAAALLLAFNLIDFRRPIHPGAISERMRNQTEKAGGAVTATNSSTQTGRPVRTSATSENASRSEGSAEKTSDTAAAQREREQRAESSSDYANLQRSESFLRAQNEALVQQLAQRVLTDKRLGRLAAMELVDERSYASGQRKGLVEMARSLLTEPGIVALDGTAPAPPPAPTIPDDRASGASGSHVPTPSPQNVPTDGDTPTTDPYAWSVFDEAERQGYLNLYNLPQVPADRSLQLWIRPLDGTEYHRVGEVPAQFYGRNGSVLYTLPANTATPSEILITQEPRQAVPAAPSGPVVLRGP